jgi:hypothetical protein
MRRGTSNPGPKWNLGKFAGDNATNADSAVQRPVRVLTLVRRADRLGGLLWPSESKSGDGWVSFSSCVRRTGATSFLVIVAIVLGIVGVVVKGLLYLLFIGIVVFLVGLPVGAVGTRRRSRRAR